MVGFHVFQHSVYSPWCCFCPIALLSQLIVNLVTDLTAAASAITDLTTRMGQAETGLTSLVTRLLRWSFDGPTDTVSITAARTSLQATTVTSLNTITATQLSYLTGLTASVEARLVGAASSIADLAARLTRWTYMSGSDAVAITSATVSLPATTAASLAAANLAATDAATTTTTATRVTARTLWAEQVQCARLQVSASPWPVAYLFNGQGTWPLLASRTTAGLGLDVVMPGWVLRFERGDGTLVAMVDARGQTDWVHQVSLTFTALPPRIILGR